MPDFDNFSKWIVYLKPLISLGWIMFFILLIGIIFKLETILHILSIIQSKFLWLGTGVKRKQIETTIKSNILKVAKQASKEMDDVLPYDLKIKWVQKSDRESFFDGNSVVVCMDNNRNKLHNIVYAVNDYVNSALLAKEKSCIDKGLYRSSCLVMTRKLLMETYEDGITFFFDNILNQEIIDEKQLKESIEKLITLDENGLFVQVMLRELKDRSSMVFGKVDITHFVEETNQFINFLNLLAIRSSGDDRTKLDFVGRYYKVGIVLVAKPTTYNLGGETTYVDRFIQKAMEGKDSIYLCARNEKIQIAKNVVKEIEKIKYVKSYRIKFVRDLSYIGTRFNGNSYPGICIHVKLEKKKKIKEEIA